MGIIPLTDHQRLLRLAEALRKTERFGAETDEPEGARYIQLSDTLAKEIDRELVLTADALMKIAKVAP